MANSYSLHVAVHEGISKNVKMNGADILLEQGLEISSGENPAILTERTSVSYAQLDAAACRAGHAMGVLGVNAGDRILIMADDRPEHIYAYLGALKIGAVPVSLNLQFSSRNLTNIVQDSACKLFLVDTQYVDLCAQAMFQLPAPAPLVVLDVASPGLPFFADLMKEQPASLDSHMLDPDDMALWMYTSGTTGEPKAVVHCLRSMLTIDGFLGSVFGVGPGDRIFCSSKLFSAYSLGHCLLAGLRLGASIILHEGWPSAQAVGEVVHKHRPHVVFSVPTLYDVLLQQGFAGFQGFACVRHFISSGEDLPRALAEQWMAATGNPILQGSGATEALIMYMGNQPNDYLTGSTGKPFPGTKVKLVSKNGEVINDPGIPGVLWVQSDSVAREYWHQKARSQAAFKDGWYVTGLVFLVDDQGFYHYQGQDDDMLKIVGQS